MQAVSTENRIVYIVTVPLSARTFLRGHIAYLRERGFAVTVISSPGEDLQAIAESDGTEIIAVPMAREISPLADLVSLWRLYFQLRKLKPVLVNASTPKAGLLGMLAARLSGVPLRYYQLRGLRLETLSGWKRRASALSEQIASACAHYVICDSKSLMEYYVQGRYTQTTKAIMIANGSSNGIDVQRFLPTPALLERAALLRQELMLPDGVPIVGFVGRFTRDKGIVELLEAFEQLILRYPTLHLLLIGRFEEGDPIPEPISQRLQSHPQIRLAGFTSDTAPYYQLMTIFAFPSYREGLPNVPLEAAIAGIPLVGFRATGTIDAVEDGVTGTLVEVGDSSALAQSLAAYLDDPELCHHHGQAARERAQRLFAREIVWEAFYQEYCRLLEHHRIRIPDGLNVHRARQE